jgi:hypothetical protein
MRYVLLMVALLLMTPNLAAADHISVYSDATGSSCSLAAGFNTSAAVIHKFTTGTTGSMFRLQFPAGSTFFAFTTAFPIIGSIQSDASINYGQCLSGSVVVGTIVAILAGPGVVMVQPANGYSDVRVWDCALVDRAATCGGAYVGVSGYCPSCQTIATDQSTWGAVKSLYH